MNEENKCEFYSDRYCILAPQNMCCEIHEDYCYYKQLQTAKEENEKLRTDKEHYFKESAEFLVQKTILGEANDTKLEIIKTLTQQNKQLKEALSWLETLLRFLK